MSPEPLGYVGNRTKCVLWFSIVCVFVWIGIEMAHQHPWIGAFVFVFFGTSGLAFLAIFLEPSLAMISADASGVSFRYLFRRGRYSWREIDDFFVGRIRSSTSVVIRFRDHRSTVSLGPNLYSKSAIAIVRELNEYKERLHESAI
jgi:hypothetical protein